MVWIIQRLSSAKNIVLRFRGGAELKSDVYVLPACINGIVKNKTDVED